MGGHLVHLVHWLHEETEKGGMFAGVGIVLGVIVGYLAKPISHPTDLCVSSGVGQDFRGHCPDLFDPERLIFVLGMGVVFGAVAILIGWVLAGGQPSD